MSVRATIAALSIALVALAPETSWAGDCEGRVVGVRPLSQYNHTAGRGFLAVRSGPGSSSRQIGEVYAGDLVSVYGRVGRWYEVTCMEGRCTRPLWGPAYPSGWVHRDYVRARGVCP